MISAAQGSGPQHIMPQIWKDKMPTGLQVFRCIFAPLLWSCRIVRAGQKQGRHGAGDWQLDFCFRSRHAPDSAVGVLVPRELASCDSNFGWNIAIKRGQALRLWG